MQLDQYVAHFLEFVARMPGKRATCNDARRKVRRTVLNNEYLGHTESKILDYICRNHKGKVEGFYRCGSKVGCPRKMGITGFDRIEIRLY